MTNPTAAPTAAPARIALWDNARFLLIVLVVIGHTLSTIRTDSALSFAIYASIYLFHMPAMIVLSGTFAKPEVSQKAAVATVRLLLTWLVFEGLWAVIRFLVAGKVLSSSFLVAPAWTLWFLVTLATMRILLPYLARLRAPLTVSILLALAAGLSPAIGTPFSVSRTLCFLPFFVAGWLARERGWLGGDWFLRPSRGLRAAAWAVFAALALGFALLPNLRREWRIDRWLTWRDDYATLLDLGGWATPLAGAGIRLALIAVAALLTLALLIVVPRGHSVMTVWGTRTLFVYLLHGFAVYGLRESGAIDLIGGWGLPGTLALIALATAMTLLLSSALVAKLARPLVEPRFDALFAGPR